MIQPAMTPEEWAEKGFTHQLRYFTEGGKIDEEGGLSLHDGCEAVWMEDSNHQIAALALHGQEFGFTWADVDLLMDLADAPDDQRIAGESLARRIAALLPPRTP